MELYVPDLDAAQPLCILQLHESMNIRIDKEDDTAGGDSRYRIRFFHRRRYDIRKDWQNGGIPLSDIRRATQIANEIAVRIAASKRKGESLDISEYLAPKDNAASFENLLPAYLIFLKNGNGGEKHKDAVERNLNNYFLPRMGRKKVRDISFSDIMAVIDGWPSELAPSSRRHRLAALKLFGSFLRMDRKLSEEWVFPEIRGGRKRALVTLTRDEQYAVINAMEDAEARPMFTFLARSACRPGEAMALMWKDVNFEKETIHIRRTAVKVRAVKGRARGQIIKDMTKTGIERFIPLSTELREAVDAVRPDIINPDSFVFINPVNNLTFTIHALEDRWKIASRSVGITVPLYEGTKHSYITQLLIDGAEETIIQRLCGHTNIGMTRKYIGALGPAIKEMMNRLGVKASVLPFQKPAAK